MLVMADVAPLLVNLDGVTANVMVGWRNKGYLLGNYRRRYVILYTTTRSSLISLRVKGIRRDRLRSASYGCYKVILQTPPHAFEPSQAPGNNGYERGRMPVWHIQCEGEYGLYILVVLAQ